MLKVMLADDEIWVLRGILNIVDWNSLGFEVCSTAMNGLEAIEKTKLLKPDVIITDIKMPGINGIELMEKIRQFRDDIIIVVISGYQEFEYARSALKYNSFDYLLKPVSQEDLTNLLMRIKSKITGDLGSGYLQEHQICKPIHYDSLVEQIKNYINKNYYKNINLTSIEQELNYNIKYISRVFKQITGMNFTSYLNIVRVEKAKELLKNRELTVQSISVSCGFNDYFYFCKVFKSITNHTPSSYRDTITAGEHL